MIHLVTSRRDSYDEKELNSNDIHFSTILEFNKWFKNQKRIQLDTETNVTDFLLERELYLVQIGDELGEEQWLFDIVDLSNMSKVHLKNALKSDVIKIAHNAIFEYTIIKKTFGIDIDKLRDTFLMSKILNTGLVQPKGYHSLAGCLERYFNIQLNKEEQTTFTKEPFTTKQLLYAANDVAPMAMLHDAMQKDIDKWDLENVVRLECAVLRPYGDAMWENFYLDKEKWMNINAQIKIECDKLLDKLHTILKEEFYDDCIKLGFIQEQDAYHFNWNSTKMKAQILRVFYPNLPEDYTTIPKIKLYRKDLEGTNEDTFVLDAYLNKNYTLIEQQLILNHHDKLEKLELFTPKDKVLINFNSPEQVLALFQLIKPEIENADKKVIAKIKHPLAYEFRSYMKYRKLVTSYGENFLEATSSDGMLRINGLNQILDTGRTSVDLYQLLPSKGGLRECFYPPEGYVSCGVDYSS